MHRTYYVYILSSDTRELYVGVTGDLKRRIVEHCRNYNPKSHSSLHGTKRLVYFEMTGDLLSAMRREKQLKRWTRRRKLELIENVNPEWRDLAEIGRNAGLWSPRSRSAGPQGDNTGSR